MKSCESHLQSCIKLRIQVISPFHFYFILLSKYPNLYIDKQKHTDVFSFTWEDLHRSEFFKISNLWKLLCVQGYTHMFKYTHRDGVSSFILRWAQTHRCECGGFQCSKFWFEINTFGSVHCWFKVLFLYTNKIWIFSLYTKLKYYWEAQCHLFHPLFPHHPYPRFLLRYITIISVECVYFI